MIQRIPRFGGPKALMATIGIGIVGMGCTHTIKVEPIKVEPIDITLHIYLEADEKLDAFFGDLEETASAGSVGGRSGGGSNMGATGEVK